jgi:hypothetical protein
VWLLVGCIFILHEHAAYHNTSNAGPTNHVEPRGEAVLICGAILKNLQIFSVCNSKEHGAADVAEPKGDGLQQGGKYPTC